MKHFFSVVSFLLLILATECVLLAQSSPFDGTWKLDPAKSKYTTGSPMKEDTVTVTTTGGEDQIEGNGTAADGSPAHRKIAVPAKGGTGKFLIPSPYESVSQKIDNENARELSETKAGKEALHINAVVSKDGKTMRVTVKGLDGQGKPVSGVAVYEKQ